MRRGREGSYSEGSYSPSSRSSLVGGRGAGAFVCDCG